MDREIWLRLRARAAGRRRVRAITTAVAAGGVALTAGLGVAFAATDRPARTSTPTPVEHRQRHTTTPHRTPELRVPITPPAAAGPTPSTGSTGSAGSPTPDAQSGGS